MEKLPKVISARATVELEAQADAQANVRGFRNHGQYVRWLITRDGEELVSLINQLPSANSSLEVRGE